MTACRNFVLALLLVSAAVPLSAQTWDWSMNGSSGVVDDTTASLGLYRFTGPAFAVKTNSIASVEARYPVTNTYGSVSSTNPLWSTFSMSYQDDTASGGAVVARLMRVDKCSDQESEMCVLTSNAGGTTTQCDQCFFIGGLDFANYTFYIDVTVTKSNTNEAPALYQVALY